MTKILKKLRKNTKRIKLLKRELSQEKDPLNGYYSKIGNEIERSKNIAEIQIELKTEYSKRFFLLEKLEREIMFEKMSISSNERSLTISINS